MNSNAQGGGMSKHSSSIHLRCARVSPEAHTFSSHIHDNSPPQFQSSFVPWPPLYPIDSPSTSTAIRTHPPQHIPSSTPSSPSSVSPNSLLSLHWNTSSSRANTLNISTPRTSLPSRSSRLSCHSCATLHHVRATPSKTARARRASLCVFRRLTRT